ncbi:MAG: FAD/NAD(P)-binding protein [Rhodopila sp.]
MFDAATAIPARPDLAASTVNATTIAIIGGGFSGTLLALHLLRRCPAHARIMLIERSRQHGPGLAYSTTNQGHLLNVPAAKMSAFPDRPLDFLQWLQELPVEQRGNLTPEPGTFAPRALYGAYISSHLHQAMQDPAQRDRLFLIRDSVIGLDQGVQPIQLLLDHGKRIEADLVVLATGNLTPCPIPVGDGSFFETSLYRHDPWAQETLTELDPHAPVLLMGAGLTMVDTVIALLDQGHRGPIHAVSRRGILPHRHRPAAPAPALPSPYPTRLPALVRFVRAQAKAAGSDWRSVVDALRPHTTDLWQALSLDDQKRFLRHLRPWWDVHRHRMAAHVADRIDDARARAQLRIHAGRLVALAAVGGMAAVTFRPRRAPNPVTLTVARVVNCTGPGIECGRLTDPLLLALLRDRVVRPDPLHLALDVTPNGAVLGADGALSQRIFAVGPVTRARFWEMTAVPDIRRQCENLAQHMAALVPAR